MTVAKARAALAAAEESVGAAQRLRDDARADVDRALAETGWTRLFAASDAALYTGPHGQTAGFEQAMAAAEGAT